MAGQRHQAALRSTHADHSPARRSGDHPVGDHRLRADRHRGRRLLSGQIRHPDPAVRCRQAGASQRPDGGLHHSRHPAGLRLWRLAGRQLAGAAAGGDHHLLRTGRRPVAAHPAPARGPRPGEGAAGRHDPRLCPRRGDAAGRSPGAHLAAGHQPVLGLGLHAAPGAVCLGPLRPGTDGYQLGHQLRRCGLHRHHRRSRAGR